MELWLTAGAGTIFGALITGLWTILNALYNRRAEAKILRNGLIAEVKSLDHIMRERKYRATLEDFLRQMKEANLETIQFSAYIGDGFNPVYKANIQKLGLLDNRLGPEIIKFHAYLYAIMCDFHEKSAFQKQGYDIQTLENLIQLFKEAEMLAAKILSAG